MNPTVYTQRKIPPKKAQARAGDHFSLFYSIHNRVTFRCRRQDEIRGNMTLRHVQAGQDFYSSAHLSTVRIRGGGGHQRC